MTSSVDVVIIGAGQAGLSLSHQLAAAGVEHLVLERGRIAETWRGRWDSFHIVIPNWTIKLPDGAYTGDDPDGFMPRDDIVRHLVGYAQSFRAPVLGNVNVTRLERNDRGTFVLQTSRGEVQAREVVVASGGYQKPHRPRVAAELPASVNAIDAEGYSNPQALPPGTVMIVGSGQTGCQLAEELHDAGREVFLACGRAPWAPRRLGGRDVIDWLHQSPWFFTTLDDLPSPAARLLANPQFSGLRGGHDLNYRTLQSEGVQLLGHLAGIREGRAYFAADLPESVAFGDAIYADMRAAIRQGCAARGMAEPPLPPPPPFVDDGRTPESLALDELATLIFTSGFRPDYLSWIRFPDAFDEMGFPIQHQGTSTIVRGLHFMGVHFQRNRKSATVLGVGDDATVLAERIVRDQRAAGTSVVVL